MNPLAPEIIFKRDLCYPTFLYALIRGGELKSETREGFVLFLSV